MTAENGYYISAGIRYPNSDLFGYPDTLIRSRVDAAYRQACRLLSPIPQNILDFGSGHGHGIKTIVDHLQPDLAVSVDRWTDYILAQQKTFGNHGGAVLRFVIALAPTETVPYLPFDNEIFDAIFLMHVIEHIPNPKILLQEMIRVGTKGSQIAITTPNKLTLVANNSADLQVFDTNQLKDLLESVGFSTKMFYIVGNDHAWDVHERKRWLAHHMPQTGEWRKKIPWKVWDKMVLRGNLTADDFFLTEYYHPHTIDLLAIGACSRAE